MLTTLRIQRKFWSDLPSSYSPYFSLCSSNYSEAGKLRSKCSYFACFCGTFFGSLPGDMLQWKPQKFLKPRVNTDYHCAIKKWRQFEPIRIQQANNNKTPQHNNGWCHYSNDVFVLLCLRNVAQFSPQNNIRPCKTNASISHWETQKNRALCTNALLYVLDLRAFSFGINRPLLHLLAAVQYLTWPKSGIFLNLLITMKQTSVFKYGHCFF